MYITTLNVLKSLAINQAIALYQFTNCMTLCEYACSVTWNQRPVLGEKTKGQIII